MGRHQPGGKVAALSGDPLPEIQNAQHGRSDSADAQNMK
jgi:hypothetical protein